ncbi:MAG: class I SAM-dependent methyltransferase [Fibrobacteres bacterium]|nr:class I SAM-dependent methyltransferase [Fibrobacterota bacterium]
MMDKPIDYYSRERSELLPLFDNLKGASVLDIGCGGGALGRMLRRNGCGDLYGVEYMSEPANEAARHYNHVDAMTIEEYLKMAPHRVFDYIVCADVLEHLVDPWSVLADLKNRLSPTGALIASIPNIRNRLVIANLLSGVFDYHDEGVLDRTHLRFFTFNSILSLFTKAGYVLEVVGPQYSPETETALMEWKANGVPHSIQQMVTMLSGRTIQLREDELIDFFTIQFLIKARLKN